MSFVAQRYSFACLNYFQSVNFPHDVQLEIQENVFMIIYQIIHQLIYLGNYIV